ncbi:hypothetical protein ACJMK2_043825 [Sinanodonta woodiana]|uniref:Uncharacterized protein n=1 Tax=Sinanodonta woodiana TaxID=1069815 RepID=A0ABD3VY56_SINWO
MWRRISLLFIAVCLMKDICCDGFEDDPYDNTDMHAGHRGPPIPGMDSSHERPPMPDMDSSHERPPMPDMDSSHERPPIPGMDLNPPNPDNFEGEDDNERDNANPERHRVGTILFVVIPVVGVLVLIVGVICGICILRKRGICIFKKRNHEEIKTKYYEDLGITEKPQIAFTSTTIYPDNPPPYEPTMEYEEIKSVPKEGPGFSAGWYATVMANMPPSSTMIADPALQIGPKY